MFDSPPATSPAGERALSERQRQVLAFVRSHMRDHGYPPTVREIGRQLGLASSSTVHSHLAALERAGILQRDPAKPRALKVAPAPAPAQPRPSSSRRHEPVPRALRGDAEVEIEADRAVSVPVVGQVAAGEPLLAAERVEQYLPVPRMLTRSGETFGLRVRGDSMIDAGILDGDYVIVRSQPTADDGQIVVALVGDEATCKYLRHRGGRLLLEPANADMSPIVPDECQLLGVVTGVLRSI